MGAAPEIEAAARRLQAGEVVAFPTETVYGLGGDATNPQAVRRIFALKGRPADHPLIVHFADPVALSQWGVSIPQAARDLAQKFWPGPLTIIVRKASRVPMEVTGGQDTVGLRCPSHSVARALLEAFARIGSGAVAAPSANRFGHVSPTTAAHVRAEFGDTIPVIDGGPCEVGLESTLIDLSRERPVLLRPGAVSREDIAAVLGIAPSDRDAAAPRASGTLAAHYAPNTRVVLSSREAISRAEPDDAVLAMHGKPPGSRAVHWIEEPAEAGAYGHDLYANLRRLDALGARRILVEAPPRSSAWEAANDRLMRAAAGSAAPEDDP